MTGNASPKANLVIDLPPDAPDAPDGDAVARVLEVGALLSVCEAQIGGDLDVQPATEPPPDEGPSRDELAAVALLRAGPHFRILQRLPHRPVAAETWRQPGQQIVAFVDAETTGLDPHADEVIEIGVVWAIADEGGIGDVFDTFSALREPSGPIPERITQITGITDAMVAGHRIDTETLAERLNQADLIVAHNAAFDRPFIERLCPNLPAKPWACSDREVGWNALGYEGTKLAYLINRSGWFHQGHRALDDCFALLTVLDTKLPGSGETPFQHLLRSSRETRSRIYAQGSPFAAKDRLKARGYRWNDGSNGRPKSWSIDVSDGDLAAEIGFLQDQIYGWEAEPPIERLTARERYRLR